MKTITFYILTLISIKGHCQDTISTEEFNNRGKFLTGKFLVLGLQSKSTLIANGDTTATIYPMTYYRIGELNNGHQEGTWSSYSIGVGKDTLFWQGLYKNDSLLNSSEFYSNGNKKSTNKYIDSRLVSSEYFLTTGKKYAELQYMNCQKEFSDFDAVEIGYYGNGKLKYVGKLKSINRVVAYYDNWYYYSDRGELYKIVTFFEEHPAQTTTYKIKGRYYEWYEDERK